ncbi:MAG TPA: pyruvate formate lyase family protein, partial [Candidatus Aminicenantes bacterium]|nr:pyruvate formate lyase family protein [Candidatus Aminicenantes bacterium]
MTERIQKLRQQSLDAVPRLDVERARLLTEFYRREQSGTEPIPVLRARAFRHLLEHKQICILPGELIVGERGPAPKAVSTYPEICLHSLEDLDLLAARPKVSFAVDETVRRAYAEEIIPYWRGKTMRERLMAEMTPEWLAAYEAGVFTEFQEQRAPGHTALGDKIYHRGFAELIAEAERRRGELDLEGDAEALERSEQLRGMAIAAGALIRFAERHAEELERLAAVEADAPRRAELLEQAAICRRVPAQAPRTFHEALQAYWFVHLGVITELNPWDSFNPGRLDLNLRPFYQRGLADGTLTRERAKELLMAFWIKFNNHPSPPKIGVTARESGTYTDFSLINVGGVDRDGHDASSDLSHLILEVIEEMRLLQPSSMVQISKKTPDALVKRALRIVRTGFGQPSLFNTEAIVGELLRQGKRVEDAREGGASGCVETGAFGRECYILSGYFNLPKILEITLNDGLDPRTGKRIGVKTGDPAGFSSFTDLLAAFETQLRHFSDIKIRGNNVIGDLYARYLPVPFLSLLIDDCLASGRDYNAGGA